MRKPTTPPPTLGALRLPAEPVDRFSLAFVVGRRAPGARVLLAPLEPEARG